MRRHGAVLTALMLSAVVSVGAQGSLTAQDRAEIQALTAGYARALGACAAEEYADLFAPETGYFASNIRGEVVGRERLMALVRSERHCTTPPANAGAQAGTAPRPVPTVAIEISSTGPIGRADLGNAGQYRRRVCEDGEGLAVQVANGDDRAGTQGQPDRSGRPGDSPVGGDRPRAVRGCVRRRGRRREAFPSVWRGARAVGGRRDGPCVPESERRSLRGRLCENTRGRLALQVSGARCRRSSSSRRRRGGAFVVVGRGSMNG